MIYFLPVFAAVMWGLWYVIVDQAYQHISLSTVYLLVGLATIGVSFAIPALGGEAMNFKPLLNGKVALLVLTSIIVLKAADISIAYSIKNLPVTYVAFTEMIYPLFVPVFAYILFNQNQLSMNTVIGGALIMAGVFFLMSQHKASEKAGEALTAQSEQRIVAIMPPMKVAEADLLWSGWVQGFHEMSRADEALIHRHPAFVMASVKA